MSVLYEIEEMNEQLDSEIKDTNHHFECNKMMNDPWWAELASATSLFWCISQFWTRAAVGNPGLFPFLVCLSKPEETVAKTKRQRLNSKKIG